MDRLEKEILKERMSHPNCMYCRFLNVDRFLYRCEKKNTKFLFNNIMRAKKCDEYSPNLNDLKLAVKVKKELNLYDARKI